MINEQHAYFQVIRPASEGLLEGGQIVHVQRDQSVYADRLEQGGYVARRHRIAELGFTVFARVTEIGCDDGDAAGGGVAQRTDEEQQAAKFVVYALFAVAEQGMDNEIIADVDDWARLMLNATGHRTAAQFGSL